jgi:signal recognition particle receptor subunit beta
VLVPKSKNVVANKRFYWVSAPMQMLLDKPEVKSTPLLVLFNKNDLKEALSPKELIKALDLEKHQRVRLTAYHSISCKTVTNIDKTLDWLIKQGKR